MNCCCTHKNPKFQHYALLFVILLFFLSGVQAKKTEVNTDYSILMGKAYSYYLLEQYDSSIFYYGTVWNADSHNIQASIGLMNSYMELKEYRKALEVGLGSLKLNDDNFQLNSKIALLYALQNNASAVDKLFLSLSEKAKKEKIPDYYMADFLMNLGNASKEADNYERAEYWFGKGDSLFKSREFGDAIVKLEIAQKERIKKNANLISGVIHYSGDKWISHGFYNGITTGLLIKNIHAIKIGYSNLFLKSKQQIESSIDSTESEKDEKEKVEKVEKDDSLQETQDLIQHNIYYSYQIYLKKTVLGTGFRISISDVDYSDHANTVFAGYLTDFGRISAGAYWYYTNIPENSILQFSPVAEIDVKLNRPLLRVRVMPSALKSIPIANQNSEIPERQFAIDLSIAAILPQFSFTITGMAGNRAFSNEPQAEVLNNVTEHFRYGTKALVESTPFAFPLTIYYLFRYNSYDLHATYSHLGGLFFQW